MKKLLSILFTMILVLSFNSMLTFAANSTTGDLYAMAEKNSSISGNVKQYAPFTVNGQKIRLFKETVLTADEAVKIYSNAYAFISKSAVEMGIDVSMDDPEFQEYAKTYAFFEGETEAITQEVKDFAKFMDLYENTVKNEAILQKFSTSATLAIDDEYLDIMMPIIGSSTIASGEITEDVVNTTMRATTYNTQAVVNYANSWWNKTNNTDYPYYGNYKNQDTSSNKYNSLDDGRPGQSSPARAWLDCTNFVSQCLFAGGVPMIKTGNVLPHQKSSNWYYSDSKPSNTWGAAANFYEHWKNRAGVASASSKLGVGDAVSIDFTGDGDVEHTVIIVFAGSGGDSAKFLSAHSIDRYMTKYTNGTYQNWSLQSLYDANYTLYGYEIDRIF